MIDPCPIRDRSDGPKKRKEGEPGILQECKSDFNDGIEVNSHARNKVAHDGRHA